MKLSYRYAAPRVCCPSGSPFMDEYKTVMVNGAEEIECVGKIPLDELIQADADSCRIAGIIKRFMAGDAAALNARASSYLDLTEAPSNLMEAQERLQKAENYFNSLPVEVQTKYNFDFKNFLQGTADGSFISEFGASLGLIMPKPDAATATEVPTDAG